MLHTNIQPQPQSHTLGAHPIMTVAPRICEMLCAKLIVWVTWIMLIVGLFLGRIETYEIKDGDRGTNEGPRDNK